MDETYDAYEKDIAVVSFFFKKDTVFEFKRYNMSNNSTIIVTILILWIKGHTDDDRRIHLTGTCIIVYQFVTIDLLWLIWFDERANQNMILIWKIHVISVRGPHGTVPRVQFLVVCWDHLLGDLPPGEECKQLGRRRRKRQKPTIFFLRFKTYMYVM